METITINGEEYVKKSDIREDEPKEDWQHVCVIAANGWIFEGYRDPGEDVSQGIQLHDAHVVRRWGNGLGIGGLAQPEHKDDYTLDHVGDMWVFAEKVISAIKLWW